MAGKTNFLEDIILSSLFRSRAAYKPAGIYIGLFNSSPSDAGGGTEVTGAGYARAQVAQLDANWTISGTPKVITNTNPITFPTPAANWGTVNYFGVFDAASGGNLLYWAALATARPVNNGDAAPLFAAGQLTVTED